MLVTFRNGFGNDPEDARNFGRRAGQGAQFYASLRKRRTVLQGATGSYPAMSLAVSTWKATFGHGQIAQKFLGAMAERARAGVKVNLVLDAIASFSSSCRATVLSWLNPNGSDGLFPNGRSRLLAAVGTATSSIGLVLHDDSIAQEQQSLNSSASGRSINPAAPESTLIFSLMFCCKGFTILMWQQCDPNK